VVVFEECDPPASEAEVAAFEQRLGFRLPQSLRNLVRRANGGRPTPNIYRLGAGGATDISECLALREGRGSLEWTYNLLAVEKLAIPSHYLPFAIDSGGNAFVTDCDSPRGDVYLLLHDPVFRLVPLKVGLDEFWSELTENGAS
jgi:hypothetical protein